MKDKIIKNLYIILIVIIGLVLTILPIIFSIKILLYKEEINSDLMQAEVLSSCISIIGFAVTVWAGLNIYNYLEKKDFEKYVEEKYNKTDLEINGLIKKNIDIVNKVNLFWKGQFLQELLKTNNDTMSAYLFDKFNKLENDNDYKYEDLVIIEQLFYQVYQIHYNSNSNIDRDVLVKKAKKGIENIRNYLKNYDKENHFLYGYLNFREAEFDYYIGWHIQNSNQVRIYLNKAINIYFDIANIFGIDILKVNNIDADTTFTGNNRDLSAYYANTIGSAYNEIRCKEYNDRAIYYCSCAVKWVETDFENEVYKRNYGIALERSGNFEEAKIQYLKAVNSNKINSKNMHTLLSIIHKIISKKLNIEVYVDPEKDREVKLCTDKYMNDYVRELKLEDIQIIKDNLQELKEYCQISKKIFPDNKDNYAYMIIYYINCLILDFDNKEKTKLLEILDIAKSELSVLELIAPYCTDKNGKKQNGLTQVLANDIKSIENEINKK